MFRLGACLLLGALAGNTAVIPSAPASDATRSIVVAPPDPRAVASALRDSDTSRAAHLLSLLGGEPWLPELAARDRAQAFGLLWTAGAAPSWFLLRGAIALSEGRDRSLAAPASRAAASIARALLEGGAMRFDVAHDVLVDAFRRCTTLARAESPFPDVRLAAADCALSLGALLGMPRGETLAVVLGPLGTSDDAELRFGAAELLSPPADADEVAQLAKLAQDSDSDVRASVAAGLCQARNAGLRTPPLDEASSDDAGIQAALMKCRSERRRTR